MNTVALIRFSVMLAHMTLAMYGLASLLDNLDNDGSAFWIAVNVFIMWANLVFFFRVRRAIIEEDAEHEH